MWKNLTVVFTSKLRGFSSTRVSYGNIVMAPLDDFFFGFALGFFQILGKKPQPKNLGWLGFSMVFCHFLVRSLSRLGFFQQEKREKQKILGKKKICSRLPLPHARQPRGWENVKPGDVSRRL